MAKLILDAAPRTICYEMSLNNGKHEVDDVYQYLGVPRFEPASEVPRAPKPPLIWLNFCDQIDLRDFKLARLLNFRD